LVNAVLLEEIEKVGSRLAKERLLKTMDENTKRFVTLALDSDITFGVTVDEDAMVRLWGNQLRTADWPDVAEISDWWNQLWDILEKLKDRRLTGNLAKATVEQHIVHAYTGVDCKWACRIVNRQLRAGFDIRTVNSVFGQGTVHKFAVQLAQMYESGPLFGLWFFQPKLDGNRVVLIDGVAMSRNGKIYPNCDHVIAELLKHDPEFFDKWVVDGEMMGDLGFDQSSGALRRVNQKNRAKATFTYFAFDLIDRNEWENQKTRKLFFRDTDLRNVLGSLDLQTIRLVPTVRIENPTHKQVMDLCGGYVKNGFEGAMAKEADRAYEFKRADNILKVKLFSEDEFRIAGFYEGKGRHKGRLGGVYVEGTIQWAPPNSGLEKKTYDVKCKVGSGFDDSTRDLIWYDRDRWLGAVVQVQFFEATKDNSLRFPVFMMRRRDKE
jgi:hypothetical protein